MTFKAKTAKEKCECCQIEAPRAQQTAFITCSGSMEVFRTTHSGGMRTACPRLKKKLLRLIGLPSQTQGMLFISVPPHQGDERELLIL